MVKYCIVCNEECDDIGKKRLYSEKCCICDNNDKLKPRKYDPEGSNTWMCFTCLIRYEEKNGVEKKMLNEEQFKLAKFIHEQYELRAKQTGWETQKNCQVAFSDLPFKNIVTMLLVAEDIISYFAGDKK